MFSRNLGPSLGNDDAPGKGRRACGLSWYVVRYRFSLSSLFLSNSGLERQFGFLAATIMAPKATGVER